MRPWEYLEGVEPKPDAPISDNPSGMWCRACRESYPGVSHCAHPEYCGGMQPMRPAPLSPEQPDKERQDV